MEEIRRERRYVPGQDGIEPYHRAHDWASAEEKRIIAENAQRRRRERNNRHRRWLRHYRKYAPLLVEIDKIFGRSPNKRESRKLESLGFKTWERGQQGRKFSWTSDIHPCFIECMPNNIKAIIEKEQPGILPAAHEVRKIRWLR